MVQMCYFKLLCVRFVSISASVTAWVERVCQLRKAVLGGKATAAPSDFSVFRFADVRLAGKAHAGFYLCLLLLANLTLLDRKSVV